MENKSQSKQSVVQDLFQGYCKEQLDNEYLKLCDKVFVNMIKTDPEVFNRGKETTWAAAIVWAMGSINFLGDKATEPYASLSDVCDYFEVNTSTVGQKASKIKSWLDIDFFNEDYQREDSSISNLLNNLVLTDEGFIVSRDWSKEEEDEDELEEDESEELPDYYIVIIESKAQIKHADLYQLEYLFKTILAEDEKFNKIEMASPGNIHLHFYGRPVKVLSFEKQLNSRKFIVSDIVNDSQE